MNNPDIFILAGESSGDLHSSYLVKDILTINPALSFCGIGGKKMETAGVKLLYDYSEINFIGFVNIAEKYFYLKNKLNFTAGKILELSPKILILCDFPGFNLRIAKKIRNKFKGKIFYYITPQVWAWHKSRVNDIKKYIDACFVILPFEKEFFDKEGVKSFYVGNPVLRQVDDFLAVAQKEQNNNKVISIMPGSRKEEIARILPKLNDIGKLLVIKYNFDVNLICSENIPKKFYNDRINNRYISLIMPDNNSNLRTIYNSDFIITKFGTSNLECAFLNVPFVAVYKAGIINYLIAKMLVNLRFVSLVNIVMNKEVVKEYIQNDFNFNNILDEVDRIFSDNDYKTRILNDFISMKELFMKDTLNLPEFICKEV